MTELETLINYLETAPQEEIEKNWDKVKKQKLNGVDVEVLLGQNQDSPCENCPNNPKNNPYASGICHCIIGGMGQIRY